MKLLQEVDLDPGIKMTHIAYVQTCLRGPFSGHTEKLLSGVMVCVNKGILEGEMIRL